MKMIKITTGNQISVHDFPDGSISEQTKLLCKYIGPECELVEHVMPKRLYTELNAPRKRGNCVTGWLGRAQDKAPIIKAGGMQDNRRMTTGQYMESTANWYGGGN